MQVDLFLCVSDRYLDFVVFSLGLVALDRSLLGFSFLQFSLQNRDLVVQAVHLLLLFQADVFSAVHLLDVFSQLVLFFLLLYKPQLEFANHVLRTYRQITTGLKLDAMA